MCSPVLFNCSPPHFPLLIDSAVERLHESTGDVHLSQPAQQVLYKYGNEHRATFEKMLDPKNQSRLDDLSSALHDRLKMALAKSPSTDEKGRAYNPPRIDKKALEQVLRSNPLLSK